MGKKSAAQGAVREIDKSRTERALARSFTASGIRHVGERASQVLARAFGSMDALCAATVEQLQDTPEIGPVLAESVRSWLDEPRNRQLIDRLRAAGVTMEVPPEQRVAPETPGPLAGKTYVITGTLDVDDARGGHGGARTPRRKGHRLGQQEDDGGHRRGGAGSKAEKGADARHSRCWTRRVSWS